MSIGSNRSGACVNSVDILGVAAGLFIAGCIKGTTGIGYTTCAMPFLVAGVGLGSAMAIVVVPAIVSNAVVIAGGSQLLPVIVRFKLFYAGIVPGIALEIGRAHV